MARLPVKSCIRPWCRWGVDGCSKCTYCRAAHWALNLAPLMARTTSSLVLANASIDSERRLLTPDLSRARRHASSFKRAY